MDCFKINVEFNDVKKVLSVYGPSEDEAKQFALNCMLIVNILLTLMGDYYRVDG